jgi:hypothetical protein
MDIKVEFALEVMGSELAKTVHRHVSMLLSGEVDGGAGETYWASSQVTMGDKPIFHMRVKKAKNVNIKGATIHSYSSSCSSRESGFYAHFKLAILLRKCIFEHMAITTTNLKAIQEAYLLLALLSTITIALARRHIQRIGLCPPPHILSLAVGTSRETGVGGTVRSHDV